MVHVEWDVSALMDNSDTRWTLKWSRNSLTQPGTCLTDTLHAPVHRADSEEWLKTQRLLIWFKYYDRSNTLHATKQIASHTLTFCENTIHCVQLSPPLCSTDRRRGTTVIQLTLVSEVHCKLTRINRLVQQFFLFFLTKILNKVANEPHHYYYSIRHSMKRRS